jgi:VanZ family protein
MSADIKSRFRAGAKVCSGIIMVLLVIGALGPANWTPRTPLGWQIDHFLGYFAITMFVCFAWPRPLVVGGILMAASVLLEGLQAFTPDRIANLEAALCGAAGVLAAALVAQLFMRARRWRLKSSRGAKVAHF